MQNQNEWCELHKDKRHQPKYPSDDVVTFVFKNFSRGGTILDLGCGAGRHIKFLAENGYNAYGCDYSQNGIIATKSLLDENSLTANLEVASISDLPYSDNFFDGLICYGVLYYNTKETIQKAANEIYRVLKPASKAYVVIRNLDDYRYKDSIKDGKYQVTINESDQSRSAFKENGMPMYFFDKDEVKRIFSKFKNIEINRILRSHENDSFADDDYAITLTK
ncbi:methyltransferase domain-containing protein [Campylobacter hyointestinalis]|uniref:class I SAM-dependent methyltransferase n=1 Tax=Campylobacter hyointestinalis TaxID=198 RepID=UPI0007266423|nr:class I SAM-dependent methyltransferase [Campylobacter hyointestinalis]PPB56673.1 SAM-dependent methyltransferase [Campylobacter hyointestinalis subsp. hyointestinalis]CUU71641.1 methyltransferase domain-containing protein [Campylobacter hyointestinalis]